MMAAKKTSRNQRSSSIPPCTSADGATISATLQEDEYETKTNENLQNESNRNVGDETIAAENAAMNPILENVDEDDNEEDLDEETQLRMLQEHMQRLEEEKKNLAEEAAARETTLKLKE